MWHLKTKLGTFWVVAKPFEEQEQENADLQKYYLGIDDQELGEYTDVSIAAKDVYQQSTGYFNWDCQVKVKVPDNISSWKTGEPENWV